MYKMDTRIIFFSSSMIVVAASTDDTGDEGKAGAIQFCTLLRGHCNICKPFLMSPGLSSKRRTPMVWLLNL